METSVNGAFSESTKADTNFLGASTYGWLTKNWSYNGLATLGNTKVEIQGLGFLQRIDDLSSSSFAFELSRSLGFNEKDNFTFGISQPLRIEKGKADLLIPQLYNEIGNLEYNNATVDLNPSGRQIDLNFGYSAKVDKNKDFGLFFTVSKDYGHVKSQELTNSMFANFKVIF